MRTSGPSLLYTIDCALLNAWNEALAFIEVYTFLPPGSQSHTGTISLHVHFDSRHHVMTRKYNKSCGRKTGMHIAISEAIQELSVHEVFAQGSSTTQLLQTSNGHVRKP